MRQDVYRVALDEAHQELTAISQRYHELRQRKETLESVIAAIGPMLGVVATQRPEAQQRQAPAVAELTLPEPQQTSPEPPAYTFNQVPAPMADESITDPFQRRVRNALKFSNSNGNGNNNGHEHRGLQPAV